MFFTFPRESTRAMPSAGSASSSHSSWSGVDPLTRQNIRAETFFSAFNGIYMGLAILAAPVVAVKGVLANPLELTILVAAFPVGVFFGPLWAGAGRRMGMQRLVTYMAFWANVPLFLIFWVTESWQFTLLVSVSQVLNSGMRMGQSSLYHLLYPKLIRGRVLGQLTFWTFITMVPSILLTGWLLDMSREMYRLLYPMAGLCGMIGCWYYRTLHIPAQRALLGQRSSFRASMRGAQQILASDRAYLFFQCAFFLSGSAFFMSTHIVLLLVCDRFSFSAFDLALWMTVVPQLLLALSSPIWGRVLDRIGIVHCRLLITIVQATSLASYWVGIVGGGPIFIYSGSILLGTTNGGGQLTWALASSHFAPRAEDVPLYNGIHFVLNGVRGLVLPWVGSVLWVITGPGAVLAALATASVSIPIIIRSLKLDRLRPAAQHEPSAPFVDTDALPPWTANGESAATRNGHAAAHEALADQAR
jgi:MFS family permease